MHTYLSIAEAAKQTGKHHASIRRMILSLLQSDPKTELVHTEQLPNGKQKYYIAADHLTPPSTQTTSRSSTQMLDVIAVLNDQLQQKDLQIKKLHELLEREQSLNANIQQRLLPETSSQEQPTQEQTTDPTQPSKRRFLWFKIRHP